METIKSKGFRPANLEEILTLYRLHPKVTNELPIIALATAWKGTELSDAHNVPYITINGGTPGKIPVVLRMKPFEEISFARNTHFAAVRINN